ncbi:MAG: DUF3108 domain-containing protein [Oceanicaulis sp.]
MAVFAALAAVLMAAAAAGEESVARSAPLEIEADYRASVWRIPVGRIALDAALGEQAYEARAVSEAAGLAALFSDVRIVSQVEGAIRDGRAEPVRYAHDEFTGDKHRRIDMSFEDRTARAVATPDFSDWGDPPADEADRAGAIDPMTAVLMLAQAMTGEEPCSGVLPVFDGRLRYDLALRARGREPVSTRAFRGEALVCDAFYRPISGYTEEQRPDPSDLRHPLTLWLTELEDGRLLPVKVRTRAGFGVTLELNTLQMQ